MGFSPWAVKTGITKALANAGYSPARITTITHPFAKAGRERSQARNTTLHRTESRSEELMQVPTVSESAPNADAIQADVDESARFVAGIGEYVCVSSYSIRFTQPCSERDARVADCGA